MEHQEKRKIFYKDFIVLCLLTTQCLGSLLREGLSWSRTLVLESLPPE